jgi:hypothetical protein
MTDAAALKAWGVADCAADAKKRRKTPRASQAAMEPNEFRARPGSSLGTVPEESSLSGARTVKRLALDRFFKQLGYALRVTLKHPLKRRAPIVPKPSASGVNNAQPLSPDESTRSALHAGKPHYRRP